MYSFRIKKKKKKKLMKHLIKKVLTLIILKRLDFKSIQPKQTFIKMNEISFKIRNTRYKTVHRSWLKPTVTTRRATIHPKDRRTIFNRTVIAPRAINEQILSVDLSSSTLHHDSFRKRKKPCTIHL